MRLKKLLQPFFYTLLPITVLIVSALSSSGCAPVVATATVGTTAMASSSQRTFGTMIDDQNIEMKVGYTIGQDAELNDQTHINVTSINFIVLLTGEAPTHALKRKAERIARKHSKVRRVHNRITIAAPSSIISRTSDTALTGRIKTAMLSSHKFNANHIKVVTENGVTYLMGEVSRRVAHQATEITRGISGVQKIVKLFEYKD